MENPIAGNMSFEFGYTEEKHKTAIRGNNLARSLEQGAVHWGTSSLLQLPCCFRKSASCAKATSDMQHIPGHTSQQDKGRRHSHLFGCVLLHVRRPLLRKHCPCAAAALREDATGLRDADLTQLAAGEAAAPNSVLEGIK